MKVLHLVTILSLVGCGSSGGGGETQETQAVTPAPATPTPSVPEPNETELAFDRIEASLRASATGQTWLQLSETDRALVTIGGDTDGLQKVITDGPRAITLNICEGTSTIQSIVFPDQTERELYEHCDDLVYNERAKLGLGAHLINSLSAEAALYAGRKLEYSDLVGTNLHIGWIIPDSYPSEFKHRMSWYLCPDGRIRSYYDENNNNQTDNTLCP